MWCNALVLITLYCSTQKTCDTVKPCESHNYYKNNLFDTKSSITLKWKHEPTYGFAMSKGQKPVKSGAKFTSNTKLSNMYGTPISEIIHWLQCVKSLNCTKRPLRILRCKYIVSFMNHLQSVQYNTNSCIPCCMPQIVR